MIEVMRSMLGASYLLEKKIIFIKTELCHGMILMQNSVPRPKLNSSHQRKTMPRLSFLPLFCSAAQSRTEMSKRTTLKFQGFKRPKTHLLSILDFLEHLGVFGYARACFLVEIELGFGVAKRFGLHFLVFPLLFHSLLLFMFVLMYILMDLLNLSDYILLF